MLISNISSLLDGLFKDLGINHFGWTTLQRPLSIDLYKEWTNRGEHQDMNYLEDHLPQKTNPGSHFTARSAIVFSIPYLPHPWPSHYQWQNQVALYAQGDDYHRKIQEVITPITEELQKHFPTESFVTFTDSAPILERDLAYRAGLGWIGKNSCLINRKLGSLFFIAEIITSLNLVNDNPWSADFCGTCNRCVEACPTSAITDHRHLHPDKCISYWTIESKGMAPEPLREKLGNWLFGCDICQTVCPWNQKIIKDSNLTQIREYSRDPLSTKEGRLKELIWILTSSRKGLAKELFGSPFSRAAGWKLQRNAIIVGANQGFTELIPFIEAWKTDDKLAEIASWALKKLTKYV